MRWLLYLLVAPVSSLLVLAGVEGARPSLSLAPVINLPFTKPVVEPQYQSLQDLYDMRDRLETQVRLNPPTLIASNVGVFSVPTKELQELQTTEIRIQIEENAKRSWDQAINFANEATQLSTQPNPSTETLGKLAALWRQSIQSLQAIPNDTLMTQMAASKLVEYQANSKAASYKYDTARSGFLEAIAERTGLPTTDVFITVCTLEGECRRWQGNVEPASPASLIKVPIAIAFMQKVTSENINLDTKITVNPGNYTEDASDIWAGSEYPLRKLLMRMINQSSNIATNQLIDFVGREYINRTLRDRGFTVTFVDYKLVGDSVYPANAGSIPNRFTTDELTEMMRQIYKEEHPGDNILIEALASQYDTVLGYDGLRNSKAIWMGEKTGQNSQMLGTTLAFTINGKYYIATIALNYSANESAIRQCVNDIAKYIERQGHL
ncbi:MAG TPA: serine hydrolase [Crinalium sp.]|jgi:beta-lactamase class A